MIAPTLSKANHLPQHAGRKYCTARIFSRIAPQTPATDPG